MKDIEQAKMLLLMAGKDHCALLVMRQATTVGEGIRKASQFSWNMRLWAFADGFPGDPVIFWSGYRSIRMATLPGIFPHANLSRWGYHGRG